MTGIVNVTGARSGIIGTITGTPSGGATSLNGLSDCQTDGTDIYGIGQGALDSVTATSSASTAVGENAGTAVTDGGRNTFVGADCCVNMTVGEDCTAMGVGAMAGTTSKNVAIGNYACGDSGMVYGYNTGVGYKALFANAQAQQNAAFGYQAGLSTTTGEYNTFLGSSAVGSGATADYECTLGNPSTSNLRCNDTTISSLSDERDKKNISDLPDSAGLAFINKLRPVVFNWDRREWYDDGVSDGSKINTTYRSWKNMSGLKQGFIAQEVATALAGEKCLEDTRIISGTADKMEFGPASLLTNAIKAIQELSAEIEKLKA